MKTLFLFALSLLAIELTNIKASQYAVNYFQPKTETPQTDTIRGAEYSVCVTMYYAVEGQCDSSPLITADGSKINPKTASEHKWIAVSQDMLKRNGGKLSYGDYVEIKGTKKQDGIYEIHDCMNKRYHNYIDILETNHTPMYKYKNISLTQVSWKTQTPKENLLATL